MTDIDLTTGITPRSGASGRQVLRALVRTPTTAVGVVIVTTLSAAAIFAPLLAPHDPNTVDVALKFAPPSATHPFGTDHLGRDVLSRLLIGARLSIGSAVVAALGITAIGIVLGMLAGYVGGIVDHAVSRVVDILLGFPTFLLALAVTGILGPGLGHLIVAVLVVWWASYARVVRGLVVAERERDYVEAARAVGATTWRILGRHVLPNMVGPVIVLTTLDMGSVLLGLSGLSFLGLGVRPPTPEWGAMLSEGRTYVGPAPQMMLFPGAAIFLMVLGFNLVGDGLRDVLDPRTRKSPSL